MDAANLSIKRTALSLAFALLIPAAAFAQTTQTTTAFSLSSTSVTLVGQNAQTVTVASTTDPATEITYNVAIASDSQNWLCVNNSFTGLTGLITSGTTSTLTLSVGNCGQDLINFTGAHTASVTLTATSPSGVAAATILVYYSVGSGSGGGGGNSQIVASPTLITSSSYASTYTTSVTLSTSSTTPLTFGLSTSPSAAWVTTLSTNTNSISINNPATLTVTLNGASAGLALGTYTTTIVVTNSSTGGTLNIPVTYYYGVLGSGSSTGGSGTISVSPTTLQWSYSTSNIGLFPSSTTVTPFSTSGAVPYTATATSSNGWLQINGGYTTGGTAGQTSILISPTSNLAALSPGTYGGTVTITETDDNATATINVTATVTGTNSGQLTISPNPISLSAAVNGSTGSTNVSITSAVSGTLTLSASGSGISLSTSSIFVNAGTPVSVTVFGSPAGLTNSTYVGSLTASIGGNTSTAEITFVVGTGTGIGTTTTVAPTQLNYYYEQNYTSIVQTQQVYLGGSGNFTVTSSTANSSANWLTPLTSSGTLPTTIAVQANAAGLASSTYTGALTIYNSSTGQSSTVNVSLLVQGITTLFASPGDAVFNYIANTSSISQFQQITVASSDSTPVSIAASVTNPTATPWLSVSGGGTTPVGLDITANASNLANGIYTGSITVTGGYNQLTIPIVLVVTGSSVSTGTGTLTLGSSSVTLQAPVNGAAVSQVLSVTANATTSFSASAQGSYNGITWITVSPTGSNTTPANLTISANPSGLPSGSYAGTVSLTSGSGTQTVQVTFVVGASTGGSTVTVTANGGSSTSPTLTFTAASVGASVAPQYITVASPTGASGTVFTASVSTTSGGSWITLGIPSGTQESTPLNVSVSVNDTGLAAGTYTGQITVTPVGGTAVNVPVTLMVGGATTIAAPTTPLAFSYQAGGATPAAQTVAVTVSNATSGSFTATATSTPAGWLVVTPTSGTAPSSLSVSISPTNLTAGTYTGSITVAGTSGATGSSVIPVTLTVTVPLPTITTVVNGASFLNEPISPGEIITIGGTNIGPGTPLSFTLTSVGGIPTVPSAALGGVQVLVNGYPAPLLYVSATQINAIVPYEVAGILRPTVLVSFLGQSSNGVTATGTATAPGIFTANGSGTGPGAILNANSSVNSATNPAARGTIVQIFMTGEGQTNPAGVDGKVTPSSGPYPAPLLPIVITVGGVAANYEFAGEAPGLVSGVMQLNVIIPPASSLTTTGAVPLVVSIGGVSSQSGVTVNVN
jgi:uncharacterized protein (TIGR03437 family)